MPYPRKYSIVPEGQDWRAELAKRKEAWTNRNLDHIHRDIEEFVYKEALNGARMADLAVKFGVPTSEFERAYGDIWRLGQAEMRAIIVNDQLEYGLKSNQPVSKIWLGKTLGGLSENGPSVDAALGDDGAVNIKVNVIRRDETGE